MLTLPRPGFPQRITSAQRQYAPVANSPTADLSSSHEPQVLWEPDGAAAAAITDAVAGGVDKHGPFDYLYEFSETRKVLEDFFKSPDEDDDPAAHIDFATDSECVSIILTFVIGISLVYCP